MWLDPVRACWGGRWSGTDFLSKSGLDNYLYRLEQKGQDTYSCFKLSRAHSLEPELDKFKVKKNEVWSAYNWFYSRTLLGEGKGYEDRKRGNYVILVILRNFLDLTSAFLALVFSKKKTKQTHPKSQPCYSSHSKHDFSYKRKKQHLPTGEKVTFKAKNLMNLSRSFLSWELRSVSIAYGNLKYNTGKGMKYLFIFLFGFQYFKIFCH